MSTADPTPENVPERRGVFVHALRNSLFGLVTLVGLNFGVLVGVTVIIEPIFSLPGIGQQLLESIGTSRVLDTRVSPPGITT